MFSHIQSHSRSNVGAWATSAGRMPWIRTLPGSNPSWPSGGRMSEYRVSTTWPSLTRTTPRAHADAGLRLAVSKSMAVKLTGTRSG